MKTFMNPIFSRSRVGLLILVALFLVPANVKAQVINPSEIQCDFSKSLIQVTPLYADSLSSSFKICINKEVKPHYHQHHTEHVYVISGIGEMQLGDSLITISAGQFVFIPANTIHSVKKTSKEPLEVISIQSPGFDGTDRIFVAE
jgi:mannose-6-phosphate isomerase-like protein (cupin superfamily)